MVEILLDQNDDLFTAVKKINESSGDDIKIVVPEDSRLGNLLSLKLLSKEAAKSGKRLTFNSPDSKVTKIVEKMEVGKSKKKEHVKQEDAFVVGMDVAEEFSEEMPAKVEKDFLVKEVSKLKFPRRINFSFSTFFALFRSKGFLIIGIAVVVLLLVGGGFGFFYLNFPTATLNLSVNPETLVKSLEVVASPSVQESDKEARVIPAKAFEFFESGSETTKVTGTETVGEKAGGKVTIYNKTDKEKDFSEGTRIIFGRTEGEDLVYLLDEGVKVPAREASTSAEGVGQSTITYIFGKKSVSVSAEKIGPEYNLSKDKTFLVDDHPTSNYIAQNDKGFSGGSKRDITVVTTDDQERIRKALTEKLTNKIRERASNEITDEDLALEEGALQVTVVSQTFDNEIGEETEEVTLNMEIKGTALVYSKKELNELLSDVLKEVVPERFSLAEDGQNISVEGVNIEDGSLKFFGKVKGYAIPKIDTEKLKDAIKGKRLEVVQSYLGSLSNIDSYEISLAPALPGPFRTLPRKTENITIEVTYTK